MRKRASNPKGSAKLGPGFVATLIVQARGGIKVAGASDRLSCSR